VEIMFASSQNHAVLFESLEPRQLMSVAPVVGHHHRKHRHPKHNNQSNNTAINVVIPPVPASTPLSVQMNGSTLEIDGTAGSDQISLSQNGSTFAVNNGSWSILLTGYFSKIVVRGNGGNDSVTIDASVTENADIYGGVGNDSITGGSGNDRIFAGAGNNYVNAGAGNDTIVAIGSASDALTGGAGTDSFWFDNKSTETVTDISAVENAAGHVHRVSGFLNNASTSLTGQSIADPKTTDPNFAYQNFSNLPLFTENGPAEDDVVQGYVGDCWFLSVLSSVAKINADRIRQSIVDLGDGTYAVQFGGASKTFVRVDADLPTWYGQAAYAGVKNPAGQYSLWVALMEKALTQYRGSASAPSYSAIDGGWMSEAYGDLGISSTNLFSAASATDWAAQLEAALSVGKGVTMATINNPTNAPLIGGHAYTVDHVTTDPNGNVTTITLRNPWGIDGAGSDGSNDGYVTMSIQQAFNNCVGATTAIV
jgi:hypothetical protein